MQEQKLQITTLKTALEQNNSIFEAKRESMLKDFGAKEEEFRQKNEDLSAQKDAFVEKIA